MPPDGAGTERIRPSPVFNSRRRSERRSCDLPVVIHTPHGDLRGRLTDISAEGAGFTVSMVFGLRPGEAVSIGHAGMGSIQCTLRWAAPPRYGAELTAGKLPVAFADFYDALPRPPGEFL